MSGEFDFDNIINNFDNIDDLLNSYREDAGESVPVTETAHEAAVEDDDLSGNTVSKSEDTVNPDEVEISPDRDGETTSGTESGKVEEFDPRFNLDRRADGSHRREYSYGGHRVSTSQDLHYEQKENPDYEELRSSYGENEEYEFDKQYGFTREEETKKPGGLKNLFRKKKKEEPYVSPVAEEESFQPDRTDQAFADHDEKEADNTPPEQKEKHGLFDKFYKKRKDPETDELDEDYAGAYSKEDSFIPAPSFGSYIASRLAAIFLRIRGGVPEEGSLGSAYAETEYMGEELQPLAASRYYGSHVFSLRFRTRIALILTLLSFWLSLGAPSPGMLSNLRVATSACLAMEFTVMLLALDIVTNAVLNCFRGKFGADFLVVLSCIFSALE